ncbi:MAG: alpha/beta fold hydrolase [Dehalococcoidia bacterium]
MVDMLSTGPADAQMTLVLAHGAGAPMDSPFMEAFAEGLAAAGVRVVRFEFPYMAGRRTGGRRPPDREPVLLQTWRDVVAELGGGPRLAIGGKSMGGRMASMVADELGVRALVCLGYPFHAPGRMPGTRIAHLAALRTPALIVQGTRDSFGKPDEVGDYPLSPSVQVHWLEDGDHDFKPRAASGRTQRQNRDEGIAAVVAFLRQF